MYCGVCGEYVPDDYSFCPHCGNPMDEVDSDNEYSPYDYEVFVAQHLRNLGYKDVRTTKKSGDYGADVLATSPEGIKICAQCKKYRNPVGVDAIQEIYAAKAYYGCDLACVYTTSSYTRSAKSMADRTGVKLYVLAPTKTTVQEQVVEAQKEYEAKIMASFSSQTNKTSYTAQKKPKKKNRIGRIVGLLFVAALLLLPKATAKEESKKRESKQELILSAENRDKISPEESTDESLSSQAIILDAVCYLRVDDHFEVVGLADYKKTSIVIQKSIDEIPVTVIQEEAFKDEEIQSVHLPDSITEIQHGAFSNCRKLTTINLPNGLTEIAPNTFILCKSLSRVSIPESVTKIQSGAFGDTALTAVNLGGVVYIGDSAFSGSHLTTVKLSSELTEIDDRAFSYCGSLQTIAIPEGVTKIGLECFAGCKKLRSISLPESLTDIGNRCFSGCGTLTEIIIPSNVSKLDSQMFNADYDLKVIQIPASCKIPYGNDPFIGCNARIVLY